MVLNALWPLLANAGPQDFSAPICSMVGTKAMPAAAGGLPLNPAPGKLSAPHCPFCMGVSDQTPALTSHAGVVLDTSLVDAPPITLVSSQPLFFSSLAAQPRGPPALLI